MFIFSSYHILNRDICILNHSSNTNSYFAILRVHVSVECCTQVVLYETKPDTKLVLKKLLLCLKFNKPKKTKCL